MSTLQTTNIKHASSASNNIVLDSSGNMTTAGTVAMSTPYAMRNKIINGAFEIDQRNAGAAVTPTASQYLVDRWVSSISQASKLTFQQLTTSGFGFKYYQRVLVAATATVGTNDYFGIQQLIEGTNCVDLEWGTSGAKTVTLSFWAYSTVAGTYGGSLRNSANNRSYPFTYVLPGSTWTYITITIPGDTSGTWLTDTGVGVNLYFSVGMGSTFSGTAGAWAGANYASATGAASIMGTSSAVFAITGVQFEVGTKATPFERRLYPQELAMCQRYFQKSYNIDIAPGTNGTAGRVYYVLGSNADTLNKGASIRLSPTMRAVPTITSYNDAGTSGTLENPAVAPSFVLNNDSMFQIYVNTSSREVTGHWAASAEL